MYMTLLKQPSFMSLSQNKSIEPSRSQHDIDNVNDSLRFPSSIFFLFHFTVRDKREGDFKCLDGVQRLNSIDF